MPETDTLLAAFTPALLLASRLWRREADKALAPIGLSHATAFPLLVMAAEADGTGGMRQGALAEIIGIEGPSLARVLHQLEAAALIRREDDAADRRAKTLHLTAAGGTRAREAQAALAARRRAVFQGADPATISACLGLLALLQPAEAAR